MWETWELCATSALLFILPARTQAYGPSNAARTTDVNLPTTPTGDISGP